MNCILKTHLQRLKQSKHLSFKLLYRALRLIRKPENEYNYYSITVAINGIQVKLSKAKKFGGYTAWITYNRCTWYKMRTVDELIDAVLKGQEGWDGVKANLD